MVHVQDIHLLACYHHDHAIPNPNYVATTLATRSLAATEMTRVPPTPTAQDLERAHLERDLIRSISASYQQRYVRTRLTPMLYSTRHILTDSPTL